MQHRGGGIRPGARLAAGFAVAALATGVAACGGDDSGGGGGGGSASGGGGGGKGAKMTLVAGVKGDEFYITMNCGAQEQAKKLGVTLNFQGPDQFDPSLQTPIVNALVSSKPDAVLIAPTDTKAMYAPIKQLADGGSKVVLVDTTLDQADLAVSQIASDNLGGGKAAAQALSKLIGGSGKVYVNNVKPGISTTDLRAQGFQSEAKKLGLQFVGMDYNGDDPSKAASQVKAQLAKNPDLKGIFATNLFGAEGAAAGLREAGKLGKVKIVGFDAGPKQVQDLKSGLVQALIAQEPAKIGADGVQQAYNALNGKATTKKIGTGFNTITKDNLAENQDAVYKASC
jgi:ribose transport system substrate-binding protein